MKISDKIMKDNKETVYTPYTYLIGWSKLNKWYYGVRYATKTKCLYESGCHPDDFWVKYHTSSEVVTAFRKEHGEPNFIKIDKTFSNADDAKAWEEKELVRLNVVKEDKWLNGTLAFPPPPMYGEDHPNYIHGRSKDPDWKREKSRKWRENNPEKARERVRNWREKNPEKDRDHNLKSSRKYRENNLEKERERCRNWRENNLEKARESSQNWREKNPEKSRKSSRKWRENNPEKAREKDRKRYAKNKLEKSLQTA
tara:strand:- start:6 stop:770 length:765 start_codon:yes stop_codon:yes gene_type:complete